MLQGQGPARGTIALSEQETPTPTDEHLEYYGLRAPRMQVEPESSEGESAGENEGVDGAAAIAASPPSIVDGTAHFNG